MVMSMSGSTAAAGTTPAIKLATASPAGDIIMPDPNMQMARGMKMASSGSCDTEPTPAQQKAAVGLVDTSWQASKKTRAWQPPWQPVTGR
jgi:hypothetical protein